MEISKEQLETIIALLDEQLDCIGKMEKSIKALKKPMSVQDMVRKVAEESR